MSGTGGRPTASEHHLGDRLAALIDGELSHESRERVLAHLATCWSCRAEADGQRRVKSVFADTAPPPPSDGLLARLQGLSSDADVDPGGDSGSRAAGRKASSTRKPASSHRPSSASRSPLSLRPSSSHRASPLHPAGESERSARPWELRSPRTGSVFAQRGFRVHELERPGSRGRRFAFAAAGAFSLAALALSGALNTETTGGVSASSGDSGNPAVGSVRAAAERGSEPAGNSRTDHRSEYQPGSSAAPPPSEALTPLLGTAVVLTPPLIRPSIPSWNPEATRAPLAMGNPREQRPAATPSPLPTGILPLAGKDPVPGS